MEAAETKAWSDQAFWAPMILLDSRRLARENEFCAGASESPIELAATQVMLGRTAR